MNRFLLVKLMLLVPLTAGASEGTPGIDTQVTAIARALIKAQDLPGLAIGLSGPGTARRFYYFGVADRRSGQPVDANTLFEIGSLSKTYAATLGAYATVTGHLQLQAPAAQVNTALAGSPIGGATLLQLATYSAGGLPLQFPQGIDDERQAIAFYKGFQPRFPIGSQRLYSNASIGLFGALAAQRLNAPYAQALQRRVLTPLKLEHTYLQVPAAAQSHYAWGHGKQDEPLRVNPGVYSEQAYGIKTTAGDLLSFVEANLDPGALPMPLAQAMLITQQRYYRSGPMTQGLGWESYDYPLPKATLLAGNTPAMALEPQRIDWLPSPVSTHYPRLFNKTGSTNGFGAYALFVPTRRVAVVILANRNYPIAARVDAAYDLLELMDKPSR